MSNRVATSRGYAAIGLYNPKSAENVGSVLRAATCYGVSMVAIQGRRFQQSPLDTTKAWRRMPLIQADDLMASIPFGAIPIAVEFIETARPLPKFTHPERAFYIFGPEDGSIPKELAARCAHTVYVPTAQCMNLAASVNVLLYDRLAKSGAWERARAAA